MELGTPINYASWADRDLDVEAQSIIDQVIEGHMVAIPVVSRGDRRAFRAHLERAARHRGVLSELRHNVRYVTSLYGHTKPHLHAISKPQKRAATAAEKATTMVATQISVVEDLALIESPPAEEPEVDAPEEDDEQPEGPAGFWPESRFATAEEARQMSDFALKIMMEHPQASNEFVRSGVWYQFRRQISTKILAEMRRGILTAEEYKTWRDMQRVYAAAKGSATRQSNHARRVNAVEAILVRQPVVEPTTLKALVKALCARMPQEDIVDLRMYYHEGVLTCRAQKEVRRVEEHTIL